MATAGGGALSKWSALIESDLVAYYNIIQTAYGTDSGETNTEIKLTVGNNLSGDKLGLSFGAAYETTDVAANLESNANSDYNPSGSITGTKLFVSYEFDLDWFDDFIFELGANMDNNTYDTSGKYMRHDESGINAWIGMYWEHIDLFVKNTISLDEKYSEIRPDDIEAIANSGSITSIYGKVRLSRTLRLYFSLDLDNQDSNIQDYTYKDTSFSISLGWTG